MKPTIKDIAQATGVSIATVSRVLAQKTGTYSAKTQKKILQAAKEMGYRKNTVAVELVKKRADVIAVIINATPTTFSTEIISGIQAQAAQRGQQTIILYAGDRDHELQHQTIITALQRSVSGILLVAVEPDDEDIRLLREAHTPFCFVSLYIDDHQAVSVSSDNHRITYLATDYLIHHGHHKIGLAGVDTYHTGTQRIKGYHDALRANHVTANPQWLQLGDYSFQTGQDLLTPYLKLGVTAIVAASDMVAAGLLKAAQQRGLTLPQDLSIISIDGTIICDLTTPGLTSITQDFTQIGQASVDRIMGGGDTGFVPITLTERQSVAQRNS